MVAKHWNQAAVEELLSTQWNVWEEAVMTHTQIDFNGGVCAWFKPMVIPLILLVDGSLSGGFSWQHRGSSCMSLS